MVFLSSVSVFLSILLLSGAVLVWEARRGGYEPKTRAGWLFRVILFGAAAMVGGALLIRTSGMAPLLALTLAPVTVLSLYRFVALVPRRYDVVVRFTVLAFVLYLGTASALRSLPPRLDQRAFVEQIFVIEGQRAGHSIDPAARRSVRA